MGSRRGKEKVVGDVGRPASPSEGEKQNLERARSGPFLGKLTAAGGPVPAAPRSRRAAG